MPDEIEVIEPALDPSIGGITGGQPPWHDGLNDELRNTEAFAEFESASPHDLFESLVQNRKFVGKNRMERPVEGSPPETWEAAWTALGRPEQPDGYQLGEIPEGMAEAWTPEIDAEFKGMGHGLGLSNDQLAGVHQWMTSQGAQGQEAGEAQAAAMHEQAVLSLRQEWGGDYDTRIAEAGRAVEAIDAMTGLPGLMNDLVFDTPEETAGFVKAMNQLWRNHIGGSTGPLPGVRAPAQGTQRTLKDELKQITSDKGYWNDQDANHADLQRRAGEIHQRLAR